VPEPVRLEAAREVPVLQERQSEAVRFDVVHEAEALPGLRKGLDPVIKVSSKVKVYEVNGIDVAVSDTEIEVVSHGIRPELVTLVVEGKRLTVAARDLDAAITNARNSARY